MEESEKKAKEEGNYYCDVILLGHQSSAHSGGGTPPFLQSS